MIRALYNVEILKSGERKMNKLEMAELERRIANARFEIELALQQDNEEDFYFWKMHLLKLLSKSGE